MRKGEDQRNTAGQKHANVLVVVVEEEGEGGVSGGGFRLQSSRVQIDTQHTDTNAGGNGKDY